MDTIAFDPSAATLVNVLTCGPIDQEKLLHLLRKNICNLMNLIRLAPYLICFTVAFGFHCPPASAQTQAATPQLRDGQHDFDFHFGTWHTHVRILVHPLTGSRTWVESDGTVTVRKIWDGRGNLEELEASNATTHFKGLTLFLYNPEAHQWSQASANINDGTLNPPLIGEFKNGRGEFYDQETYNGRSILVRFVWSDITADSHHVEQSYSADGGKTWEPNLVADLTREKD